MLARQSRKQKRVLLRKAAEEVEIALTSPLFDNLSEKKICENVASKYKINIETLRTKLKRARNQKDRQHGLMLMSYVDECRLVGYILAMEQLGQPLKKQVVCFY